jgi:molecular chaperone GrpE
MDEDKRVSSEAAEDSAAKNAETGNAGPDASAMAAENQALRAQMDELNDRNLRLVAEMENLRRRTERDKSEFAKYAISEFARDILVVGDNVRRAIDSVPKEAVVSHPALASLIEGVEMTERDLIKVLERYQVKRFDPLGEPFNPHLHEAMTKIDVPNVPADTVIQTLHAGFMIGERVLRPAAVIVAKGGGVAEQPRRGEGEETIPTGAMRVPNDAVSSSSAPPQRGNAGEAEFFARTGRMATDESWRPDANQGQENPQEERVAPIRRPRQSGGGGAPGPGPFSGGGSGPRQQNRSSSALHKPVITPKRDW